MPTEQVQLALSPPSTMSSSLTMLRLDMLIGVVVVWCASGLVALDMSQLYPSAISPTLLQVTHLPSHGIVASLCALPHHLCVPPLQLSTPIMWSTIAFLTAAPFMAHITGMLLHKTYRLWQPFRGGRLFVLTQTVGWVLIAAGIVLVGLECTKALSPPGLLIGVACLSLTGNAALLASLHLYTDGPEGQGCILPKGWRLALLVPLGLLLSFLVLFFSGAALDSFGVGWAQMGWGGDATGMHPRQLNEGGGASTNASGFAAPITMNNSSAFTQANALGGAQGQPVNHHPLNQLIVALFLLGVLVFLALQVKGKWPCSPDYCT